MIPVLLLVGLLTGRSYVPALAALAWPVLLGLNGIIAGFDSYAAASLLAFANATVGVAMYKAVAWALTPVWGKVRARVE